MRINYQCIGLALGDQPSNKNGNPGAAGPKRGGRIGRGRIFLKIWGPKCLIFGPKRSGPKRQGPKCLGIVPVDRNLTSTRRAVSFKGPDEWNKLPPNIRGIERLFSFKKELKKFLLDQYEE